MADPIEPQSRPIVTLAEARDAGLKRYFTGKPCHLGHIDDRLVSNLACITCLNRKRKEAHDTKRGGPPRPRISRSQTLYNSAAGLKGCYACGEAKSFTEFNADNSRADGLQPRCRDCYRRYCKDNAESISETQRRWNEAHVEEILEYRRQYWLANKESLTVKNRAYALAHADELAIWRRNWEIQYRAKNGDRLRQKSKDWMAANKESFAVYAKEWRAENAERCSQLGRAWKIENAERIKTTNKVYRQANKSRSIAHVRNRQAKKKMATPVWADFEEMALFYFEAEQRSAETGSRHSVDHIVPLNSPYVCGLHCTANLQVITLSDNISKGNRWWPDMGTICPDRYIGQLKALEFAIAA